MAVKRFRKYGKKRRGLRRRTTRRANRVYRSVRSRPNHYFSRFSFAPASDIAFSTNANGQYFGAIYAQGLEGISTPWTVVSMPNVTEFTGLFDQFKLFSYTIELIPRFTDVTFSSPSAGSYCPSIFWYFDTDDSTAPSTSSEVMQHQYVRTARLNKPVRITVKYPCVATTMYGSLASNYGSKRSPWIDCQSVATPHYGLKFMIQGVPSLAHTGLFDVRCKWRFACKNPR